MFNTLPQFHRISGSHPVVCVGVSVCLYVWKADGGIVIGEPFWAFSFECANIIIVAIATHIVAIYTKNHRLVWNYQPAQEYKLVVSVKVWFTVSCANKGVKHFFCILCRCMSGRRYFGYRHTLAHCNYSYLIPTLPLFCCPSYMCQ